VAKIFLATFLTQADRMKLILTHVLATAEQDFSRHKCAGSDLAKLVAGPADQRLVPMVERESK